uniref:hypothetical protein n=1 Tax=Sulfolobus sp. NOB8H2 TaxID=84600 RepID=UPI0000062638|nr:hypothetical protein [Sulfolobus sp. NOB8H2]CAA09123.1 hypothetical protein [Sulfolobus sp. NOB8H2]
MDGLVEEIIKFNGGYTLIARVVGKSLGESGCSVNDISELLRNSKSNALLFLIFWINYYLGIVDNAGRPNAQRIETFSEILTIREPFKLRSKVGDYIATPYFIGRLAYWSSNKELGLSDEEESWLAINHEDLVEEAMTEIVKAVNGGQTTSELNEALRYWREYGRLKITGVVNFSNLDENIIINYIFVEYGEELKEEFKNIDDKCWKGLILTLGTAWSYYSIIFGEQLLEIPQVRVGKWRSYYSLHGVLESAKKRNDLADDVREAVEYLDGDYCDALKLLVANRKSAAITLLLLVRPEESLKAGRPTEENKPANPILYSLAEGKSKQVKESLERLLGTVRKRGTISIGEEIYGLGLSILTAYANREGIKEYDELTTDALKLARWSILQIAYLGLVVSANWLWDYLRNYNPNYWALALSRVTTILLDNREFSTVIKSLVDDLWEKRDDLEDWGKAHLVIAMATTLPVSDDVYGAFNNIVKVVNGMKSVPLKRIALAHGFSRLYGPSRYLYFRSPTKYGNVVSSIDLGGCSVSLSDPLQSLSDLISCFDNADSWLSDDQLVKYLREESFRDVKDALNYEIDYTLGLIYGSLGWTSILYKEDVDRGVEYYKKAREFFEKIRAVLSDPLYLDLFL